MNIPVLRSQLWRGWGKRWILRICWPARRAELVSPRAYWESLFKKAKSGHSRLQMAQWLRALATLLEDPVTAPSTAWWITTIITPVSGDPVSFSCSHGYQVCTWLTGIDAKDSYTFLKKSYPKKQHSRIDFWLSLCPVHRNTISHIPLSYRNCLQLLEVWSL